MGQLKLPDEPTIYSTQYENLLGVDYQRDATAVDKKHSPKMINMISDLGGNPIKRDGYRVVANKYNSMLVADSDTYGIREAANGNVIVAKLNTSGISIVEATATRIYKDCGTVNGAFSYQQYIYVLCNNAYIKFDTDANTYIITGTGDGMMSVGTLGESAPSNADIVPDVVIGLKPNGTGGTTLDDKNIMSIYQRCNYQGDGTTKAFIIPNYTKVGSWVKVEVKDTNGDWKEAPYTTAGAESLTGKSITGTGTVKSNIIGNTLTLSTAPAKPEIAGQDNVRITYAPYSTDQIDSVNKGFYNKSFVALLQSKINIYYNLRLFIADEDKTYYSDVNNPFVISDLHWFDVDNTIVCYTRSSSYLAIITKDNGRNTIFLASPTTVGDTTTTSGTTSSTTASDTAYVVKPSNAGVGAISSKCLGTLNDEPTFLSATGIFGILTNWQSDKYAVNRSGRINRQLCKESNLDTAVGATWNGYFYIAINGRMYVMDGRHKNNSKSGDNSYECYFFDSMPIVDDIFIMDNVMYFTDDVHTYRWNSDLAETNRYYDLAVQDGDGDWSGNPVIATWASVFDDDGYPQKLKTLNKKGSMLTLMPHYQSGCTITLIKDGDAFQNLGRFDTDMFTFERIDFSRFSFNANQITSDVFMRKKIKKYKRLQIILENDKAEPFGITNVVKSYTYGNYAKK